MPRKGPAPKRPVIIDPVYGSPLVSQLVSKILLDGTKTVAQSIVYDALEGTRTKTGTDPVQTLKRALDNVKPSVEVKSRRVGGATYQVPIAVKPARQNTLAMRWLVSFSRWANLAYSKRGVHVTAVCPGFTHTEFHDRMGMDKLPYVEFPVVGTRNLSRTR